MAKTPPPPSTTTKPAGPTSQDGGQADPGPGALVQAGSTSPVQPASAGDMSRAAADMLNRELLAVRAERDEYRRRFDQLSDDLEQTSERFQKLEKRLHDSVKVIVLLYDHLVLSEKEDGAGKTAEEAVAIVAEQVADAVAYLAEVEAKHGSKKTEPKAPSREETGPYVVTETKHGVNYGGGLTTIPVGTRVDLRGYGVVGIARLREQGVKMRLLSEEEARAA